MDKRVDLMRRIERECSQLKSRHYQNMEPVIEAVGEYVLTYGEDDFINNKRFFISMYLATHRERNI